MSDFKGETIFRQLVFLKKRNDLTEAQFREYWSETHSKKVRALAIFQETVVRYEQVRDDRHSGC